MAFDAAAFSEALDPFTRASAELLAARALQRRVDTKFVVPVGVALALLPALEDRYAVLGAGDGLVATYQTLYFDTPDLTFFHDHRRGRRQRQKVRIRHYPDRLVSYLEVKSRKSDLLTQKARLRWPFAESDLSDVGWAFLREHARSRDSLQPTAWTNFRRVTLIGTDHEERVTFDLGLEVRQGERRERYESVVIVEVKQPRVSRRTPIREALQRAGFRPGWASKYCTAVIVTRPGVRCNRLSPRVRRFRERASC